MKRLKGLWNRFVRLCLPTYRSKVVAILIVGIGAGLGVYLVYMSMVWNYAGSDPKTCVQCHVMEPRTFHPLMQFLKNDVFDDFIGCLIV